MSEFLLTLIAERAWALWIALALTFVIGWPLGHVLPLDRTIGALHRLIKTMGRKLNKQKRDATTRAWRGVIATAFVFVPAVALGWYIDAHLTALAFLSPMLIFIGTQRRPGIITLWRQAKADTLTLQLNEPNYLFADTHALLRYAMLDHATRFAIGIVGVMFWYVVFGSAGALGYLALATCAAHYATERDQDIAFGGATDGLFQLADAIPRTLTKILLAVASIFAPGARPRSAARHFTPWPLFLAELLGIALGGAMPMAYGSAQTEWVGSGTPKPDATHLTRWLLIWAVALLVLMAAALPTLIQLKY